MIREAVRTNQPRCTDRPTRATGRRNRPHRRRSERLASTYATDLTSGRVGRLFADHKQNLVCQICATASRGTSSRSQYGSTRGRSSTEGQPGRVVRAHAPPSARACRGLRRLGSCWPRATARGGCPAVNGVPRALLHFIDSGVAPASCDIPERFAQARLPLLDKAAVTSVASLTRAGGRQWVVKAGGLHSISPPPASRA